MASSTAASATASKSQFKATEKWCELIAAFRDGMPTSKHWHMFHWLEDTFSGCEAVEWMYSYLKSCPEFNKVTRENAHQLLQKFLDAGIMEDIKKSKGKFEYSGRLYKLIGDSQTQTRARSNTAHVAHGAKNALGLANDGYQSDSDLRSSAAISARLHIQKSRVQHRPITEEDVHLQWKMALVSKFEDIFGRGMVSQLIDVKVLSGAHVFFNTTHVAANGMLSDIPPSNDLPEWVVSSLSFLSRWTDDVSNNLPHYPGVEVDLLRVILQSFENIPDPLIPCVFHRLVLFSIAPELVTTENGKHIHLNQPLPKNNLRFESIENLLTDMASVSIVGCPSPILPSASHHASRGVKPTSGTYGVQSRSSSSSRYNIRLETAFVGPNNETYTTFKFEETKPTAALRQVPTMHTYGDNVLNNNGQQQLFSSGGRCQSVQSLVWQSMAGSSSHHPVPPDQMQRSTVSQSFTGNSNLRPFGSNLENIASIKHADSTSSLPIAVDLACAEYREPAVMKQQQPPSAANVKSGAFDPVISLQMALLFMPPPERRRLQMFLRLLARLLENKLICQRLAPPHGDLRSLLITMFAPVFIRPKTNDESAAIYSRMAAERLSALLLDKHAAIFAVPDWLTSDVNGRLDRLRRLRDVANTEVSSPIASPQSPATPSPRSVPAFCQRISMREYERQSSLAPAGDDPECSSPTRESLFELLAAIVSNASLSKKERAKRLKEFEKMYPDIYSEHFSRENSVTELEASVNKENTSQQSPSAEASNKSTAPWMPRIKEPMLLKKIRQRFGNEQQQQQQ